MEILITDEKTLGEIKNEFSTKFPHLKIDFYKKNHEEDEGTSPRYQSEDSQTVDDARKNKNEGHLSINGNQKTSTLESKFKEIYGLNVQVFRNSGGLWMQTTATDEWTLSHQEETAANRNKQWDLDEKEFSDND